MNHMEPMSLQEVADELGVSKQMVARIEKRALRKAKEVLEGLGLSWEDYLDEIRAQEAYAETESGSEICTHDTPWANL